MPDSVSRTAAPVTMIAPRATSAATVIARYACGEMVTRRSESRREVMRCTGPAYGCPWSALQTPPQRCLRVRPAEAAGPTLPYVSAPVLSRRARLAASVALPNPRIIDLLSITTVPTLHLSDPGLPSPCPDTSTGP